MCAIVGRREAAHLFRAEFLLALKKKLFQTVKVFSAIAQGYMKLFNGFRHLVIVRRITHHKPPPKAFGRFTRIISWAA